jgi:hypothetical protein
VVRSEQGARKGRLSVVLKDILLAPYRHEAVSLFRSTSTSTSNRPLPTSNSSPGLGRTGSPSVDNARRAVAVAGRIDEDCFGLTRSYYSDVGDLGKADIGCSSTLMENEVN